MSGNISHTIIAKSDQLNAGDIIANPITVTVEAVNVTKGRDQPVSIVIGGGYQPYKPCLTMRRVLASLWGAESKDWYGRRMTLYCDESVTWAGEKAGGIRISHMSDIGAQYKEVPVRASKHKTMAWKVYALKDLSPYQDSDIEKNKDNWIANNVKPKALIAKIKQQFTLTKDQEAKIVNLLTVDNSEIK